MPLAFVNTFARDVNTFTAGDATMDGEEKL